MVLSYLLSQLIPLKHAKETGDHTKSGFLLVIGVHNVDQALLGFNTKYDESSGDLNPIGTLNTAEIRRILLWMRQNLRWDELQSILDDNGDTLPPLFNHEDEENDLNLTYAQLEILNKFRNERLCGPFSMFDNLTEFWPDIDLETLHETVIKFFDVYAANRHKSVVMTPALYMSNHSCDSNKYDYRPWLYTGFEFQYQKMAKLKEQIQMSNVTKQHKEMNLRHAYVGNLKDYNPKMLESGHKGMKDRNISTAVDVKVPEPFDFAEKGINIDANIPDKTFTPDPEPTHK